MTDIEQKALALVNEVLEGKSLNNTPFTRLPTAVSSLVLLRAIERHEAFKQEVSDAVAKAIGFCKDGRPASAAGAIGAFVISKPKPDPLVEVLLEIDRAIMWADICAEEIRASLRARGFEIREKKQ